MLSQWLHYAAETFLVYGPFGLFLLAFAESSFFPVPPDVLLIAMSLQEPRLAPWYALVTTVGSVLGGVFGYFIGTKAGRPLLDRWVAHERIRKMEKLFHRYGGWAVAIAGFTPIPYKVFTIGAGLFRINKGVFLLASLLSRGTRFFLEGFLIFFLGSAANTLLSSYLEIITISVTVLILLLYLVFRHTKTVNYFQTLWLSLRKKVEEFYKKKISPLGAFGNFLVVGLALGVGFMLLFAKLAEDLLDNELKLFDQIVIGIVHTLQGPVMTTVMKVITNIGSPPVMIGFALVAVVLLLVKKHFWDATMVGTALAGSWLMNELLKGLFQRTRPDAARLVEVTGYSFPSGHAMVSFALYGMLAYLIWINLTSGCLRTVSTLAFALLVVAIGISRIYLGVHYPSDVLAGFAAGGFWLVGCILGLQTIRYYKGKQPPPR